MYAGNVGFSQSLELLVMAAATLRDRTRRRVRGQRRRLGPAGARAGARRASPTSASPTTNRKERLAEVLATADIHVVPLQAGPGALERAVEDVLDPRRRPAPGGQRRPRHGGGPRRGAGRLRRRRRRPTIRRRSSTRCARLVDWPGRRGRQMGAAGPGASSSTGRRRPPSPRRTRPCSRELARRRSEHGPASSVIRLVGKASSTQEGRPGRPRPEGAARYVGQRGLVFPIALGRRRAPRRRRSSSTPATSNQANARRRRRSLDRPLARRLRRLHLRQVHPAFSKGADPNADRPARHPHPRRRRDPHPPVQLGDRRARTPRSASTSTGRASKLTHTTSSCCPTTAGTYKTGDELPRTARRAT